MTTLIEDFTQSQGNSPAPTMQAPIHAPQQWGQAPLGQAPLGQEQKNDPPLSPVGPYNLGNGIFYMPWSNNGIVSTLIMPRGGLIDRLPVLASDPYDTLDNGPYGSRQYSYDTIMTGLTEGAVETFANQPTGDCVVGPLGGLVKLCTLINTMARYRGSTREVSMFQAGLGQDRLDQLAHQLLNSAPALQAIFGSPGNMPEQYAIIASEAARRMWELLTSFRRYFSRAIWTDSPANNDGEARQMVGMQIHINEANKFDAFSGAQCVAADSIVMDFEYNRVDRDETHDIIEVLEAADYSNRINAERMGLGPVEGAIVMKEALFHELSDIIPVKQYQAVMASLQNQAESDNTRIMINATDAQRDRMNMRSTLTIPLNGRMVAVIIDDGIPEQDSTTNANLVAGEFSSDIYFVPFSVMGGMPATFFQYYNHDNVQAQGLLERIAGDTFTFTSDGGVFRWYINFANGCLQLTFDFSPWLKCKFPMVGWRISNVAYLPTHRPRSAYPDSDYFADGGTPSTTSQPSPSVVYPPWASTPGDPINI